MEISNATFGYDVGGKNDYINAIHAVVIDQAAKDATDIKAIIDAVDTNWKGAAAEQFKTALTKDANDVSTALNQLYEQLVKEINNIGEAIADFDNGLMNQIGGE